MRRDAALDRDLIEPMPGPVVVHASDDEVDLEELRVIALGCQPREELDGGSGVQSQDASASDKDLRGSEVREFSRLDPVEVGDLDKVVVEQDEVADPQIREERYRTGAGAARADDGDAQTAQG
jgi:hypothetical protein